MLRALIVGPQASGKGLLHNVLAASPQLPQPGSFQMQSVPAGDIREAERYIVVHRGRAVDAIARHNWARPNPTGYAQSKVLQGWNQLHWFVLGLQPDTWIMVDYRDMVADIDSVIEQCAQLLDVDPWTFTGRIFDGDRRLDADMPRPRIGVYG